MIKEGTYTAFSLLPLKGQVIFVIERFMLVWGALTLASLIFLFFDFTLGRRASWGIRLAWVTIFLIFGPLGLWVYLITYRRPLSFEEPRLMTTSWKDAMGSTALSVAVYVAVVYLLIAMFVMFMPGESISYWLLFVPFLVGLFFMRVPLTASLKRIGYVAALGNSVLTEVITFSYGAAGILATTVFLLNQWFPREIRLTSPLFMASVLIAAIVGAFFIFPINVWMSERNFKKSLLWIPIRKGASESVDILRTLKIKDGWISLIIALALLAGSIGWVISRFG